MSKLSRRPNREVIKRQRKERKKAEKVLRRRQNAQGLVTSNNASMSNRKSDYKTVEEEQDARVDAVTHQLRVFRSQLPILLKRLARVPDPRNPKKVKHKLTILMIYGILTFIFQMASRREANREMTRPMFMEKLLSSTIFLPLSTAIK